MHLFTDLVRQCIIAGRGVKGIARTHRMSNICMLNQRPQVWSPILPFRFAGTLAQPSSKSEGKVSKRKTARRKKKKAGMSASEKKEIEDESPSPKRSRHRSVKVGANAKIINPAPFLYEIVSAPDLTKLGGPVPKLEHGLERVLFSPGVHVLQDSRSKVYNFDPWLQKITPPEDFNFDALPPYVTASRDDSLIERAIEHDRKYAASTSSITQLIAKIYQSVKFTMTTRSPTSALLRFKKGIYVIDQEKSDEDEDGATNNILMQLGKSMEKMVTMPIAEFEKLLKNAPPLTGPLEPDAYVYAKVEKFLLRSQLDCMHPSLPKQSFDLKTRATLPIRMDPENFKDYLSYKLTKSRGLFESYEREYYDMVRSAMLKYNFQVRIGNMDGILVCYHNTDEIFGFQYLSVQEMDEVLYGSSEFGDASFAVSIKLLEAVIDTVTKKFWGKDIRLTLKGSEKLQVWFFKSGVSSSNGNLSVQKLVIYAESGDNDTTSSETVSDSTSLKTPTLMRFELKAVGRMGQEPLKISPMSEPKEVGMKRKAKVEEWNLCYEIQETGSTTMLPHPDLGPLRTLRMAPTATTSSPSSNQVAFAGEVWDDGLGGVELGNGEDMTTLNLPSKGKKGGGGEQAEDLKLWAEYVSTRRACGNLMTRFGRNEKGMGFMRSFSRSLIK
ncbi:hypothetical protein HDU97_009902 [Phlyctochytrium planicorne]|nr:hypothetical protein HDU97_009902 [Phlyctochytrium planicorne]